MAPLESLLPTTGLSKCFMLPYKTLGKAFQRKKYVACSACLAKFSGQLIRTQMALVSDLLSAKRLSERMGAKLRQGLVVDAKAQHSASRWRCRYRKHPYKRKRLTKKTVYWFVQKRWPLHKNNLKRLQLIVKEKITLRLASKKMSMRKLLTNRSLRNLK